MYVDIPGLEISNSFQVSVFTEMVDFKWVI